MPKRRQKACPAGMRGALRKAVKDAANKGERAMNAEQALAEVCQRFCSAAGDAHDDACVALSTVLICAERDERAVLAGLALADRADARADVDRRLVTTDALRAALLAHVGSA